MLDIVGHRMSGQHDIGHRKDTRSTMLEME